MKKNNEIALVGFVCSICGFLSMGIISIAGIVLSIIGLKNAKKQEGKNKSYALAGLIIGIAQVIMCAFLLVFIILTINNEMLDSKINKSDYKIIESIKKVDKEGLVYIEGKMKNIGKKDINYINILYETYDIDGNLTGNCNANISRLKPNKTWQYVAFCDAKTNNVNSFKISEITGEYKTAEAR